MAGGVVANLAEGTGTLFDIARRRGLAKTAFQQTKWRISKIEFFPIPGSSDGTLAHFFFLLKSIALFFFFFLRRIGV